MKYAFFVLVCSLSLSTTVVAFAAQGADQTVAFTDGSTATTYGHCGDTDLCASIKYPNGDILSIFSEGAAYCQPYMLHFVKVNGAQTAFEYTRTINHDLPRTSAFGTNCGHSQDTQMVMDRGLIHMTVSENHDGTLSIVFTPTKQGDERRQATDTASPSPR